MNMLIEPSLPTARETSQPASKATIFRVLVVDDEGDIRNFITEVLNECNYIADGVSNGEQALVQLGKRHYDVLLTDYHMPKITGIQLIASMRAKGINLPVVLMTGQRESLLSTRPGVKVNAFLEKPFIIEQLLQVLSGVLHPDSRQLPLDVIELASADHESRRTAFF